MVSWGREVEPVERDAMRRWPWTLFEMNDFVKQFHGHRGHSYALPGETRKQNSFFILVTESTANLRVT